MKIIKGKAGVETKGSFFKTSCKVNKEGEMEQITIKITDIFSETHFVNYKLQEKIRGNQRGWDFWILNNNKWQKKTRGNKYLIGNTFDDAVKNLLTCGEYVFKKELVTIKEEKNEMLGM